MKGALLRVSSALSLMLSTSTTLENFMGMADETGETGSTRSRALLSIFCLTSGLRELNFKAKNVMSLFSGSTMTAFLREYQFNCLLGEG